MRKIAVALLFMLSLSSLSLNTLAQRDDMPPVDVAALARYFPEDTVAFAATRTDDVFFDELEALTAVITEPLKSFGVPPITLRQGINLVFQVDADRVLSFLGDGAAAGITGYDFEVVMANPQAIGDYIYFIFEVDDREAADDYLGEITARYGYDRSEQGEYTLFVDNLTSISLVLNDELLIASLASADLPDVSPASSLADTTGYQDAVESLPAESYNLLLYLNSQTLLELQVPPVTEDIQAAPLAVGFTILDGNSLVIDAAQLPIEDSRLSAPATIDPDSPVTFRRTPMPSSMRRI